MNQMIFSKDGSIIAPKHEITPGNAKNYVESLGEIKSIENERAVCPFCLYESTLDKFAQLTSDNKIAKTYQCPVCGQEMKLPTLYIFDKGPEAYSEWFWSQIYEWRGRDRMSFDAVKATMKSLGCSDVFWDMQKKVKLKKESGE
jgi:hypothetical protein